MAYQDVLFEAQDGVATITINRPQVMNVFRGQTCEELIHALNRAGWDKAIGVIVLTGADDRAFCTGGAQSPQSAVLSAGACSRRSVMP
jgi:2-ketocyclohexanecarboxyl-CoA hydrolase